MTAESRDVAAPPPQRRRRRWPIVLGVAALVVAVFVGRVLWIGGAFKQIAPHFSGTCRLIDGPVGAEDITINQRTGRAYLSATDRRARDAGHAVPGAIWEYNLTRPDAQPVNLTPDAGIDFQPHGISLWIAPDGRERLFIINHSAAPGSPANDVQIADVAGDRLQRRSTLTDPLLVTPNDIVAVGPETFYLTNTHRYPRGVWQTVETYLQLRGANVLLHEPDGFRVAVKDLVFPNGINVSPDGRTLYVATVTWQSVLVYDRDPVGGALTLRDEIAVGSGPDNIEVDPEGNLWIGSHPKLLAMAGHAADPAKLAPAQVLRIGAGSKSVEEIYLSAGEPLGAASVGARYGNRLLIGQIFGRGFLDCTME